MQPSFLTTARGYRIAYQSTPGEGPCVMFCGGYRSDMEATKGLALAEWCMSNHVPLIRFDYNAHGKSDGDFMDFTIGNAMADALDVVDHIAPEEVILVGSSMGSWVSLNTALERKALVRGFVGIASAPDFTERLMRARMSPEQRREMDENGLVWVHSEMTDSDYPVTQAFLDEARNHLLLDDIIGLDIPVHLRHGQADIDVPWETSVLLAERLMSDDVNVTLIKDGEHRLNRPHELLLMTDALARMLA